MELFMVLSALLWVFKQTRRTCYKASEGTLSLLMDARLFPLIVGATVLGLRHLYLATELLSVAEAWWQLIKDCVDLGHWSQGTQLDNYLQHGEPGSPGMTSRLCVSFPGKGRNTGMASTHLRAVSQFRGAALPHWN